MNNTYLVEITRPDTSAELLLQAGEPLGQFMDFCTYGFMIDNIVLIVTGTLHERDVQVKLVSSK